MLQVDPTKVEQVTLYRAMCESCGWRGTMTDWLPRAREEREAHVCTNQASVVSASVGGTEDGPVREEGREGGPEAPNPARSSVSADEPCGDTVTCRDDEHEQLTCVLPKGHRSSHTTDEGAWWTDKDHWDGMDAPEVDDASDDPRLADPKIRACVDALKEFYGHVNYGPDTDPDAVLVVLRTAEDFTLTTRQGEDVS